MADSRGPQDVANGFIRLDPEEVGDSYSHSPQGADSRGPMMNWRTQAGVEPQQTDIGEKTHHEDTGSYEGHVRPKEVLNHRFGKSGANEPPIHGKQTGKEVEKVTDLDGKAGATSSVGGGSNY
jgi:hypothetical protein